MPAAKGAVGTLRQRIDDLLDTERQSACTALDDHEGRIRELEDFGKLDDAAQVQVLSRTGEARSAVSSARFLTAIRDRMSRYRTQDYPAQLALAAQLAAPPAEPKPGEDPDEATPSPSAPTYVPASSLAARCPLPYIGSEAELDQWLAALREAAVKELEKGHRISL